MLCVAVDMFFWIFGRVHTVLWTAFLITESMKAARRCVCLACHVTLATNLVSFVMTFAACHGPAVQLCVTQHTYHGVCVYLPAFGWWLLLILCPYMQLDWGAYNVVLFTRPQLGSGLLVYHASPRIGASHTFTEPLQATYLCVYRNSIKETGTQLSRR